MQYPGDNLRKFGKWASRFADTVGDGSGLMEGIGVHSPASPLDLHYNVPAGFIAIVDRLIVTAEDSGNMTADTYGALPALTNGIIDGITQDGVFTHSGDLAVKTNADWASLCHDMTIRDFGNTNAIKVMTARYTFLKDGAPLMVQPCCKLTFRIQDDTSGLTKHRFRVGAILCPVNKR